MPLTSPTCRKLRTRPTRCLQPTRRAMPFPAPRPILRTQRVSIVVAEEHARVFTDGDLTAGGDGGCTCGLAEAGRLYRSAGLHRAHSRDTRRCSTFACTCADLCRVATTLGYGPRFQHSTGQLHKGGANNGVFIQLVAEDQRGRAIPGCALHLRRPEGARRRWAICRPWKSTIGA